MLQLIFIAISSPALAIDGSTTTILTTLSTNGSARITRSAYVQYAPKVAPTAGYTTRAPFSLPTKTFKKSTNIHQAVSAKKASSDIATESREKSLITSILTWRQIFKAVITSINVVPTTPITNT